MLLRAAVKIPAGTHGNPQPTAAVAFLDQIAAAVA
jgi:hypothetical protein